MINERSVVEDRSVCDFRFKRKCISWSAVIAGTIVATAISFLFNLFGVAISLSAFTNTQAGVATFAIGGFIGLIIISFVSMFVGGMVAGYLGRRYCLRRNLGILYGFLTFGVTLFLAVLLTSPMTRFVTHYNQGLYNSSVSAVVANPASDSSTVVSPRGVTTNAPAMDSNNSVAAQNTEQNVNILGKAAFLTFILFAVGAFAACIGGHCGMRCKCRDEDFEEEVVTRERIR